MNFEDALHDIETLKGKVLCSLGRGSSIRVLGIDYEGERVEIEVCKSGTKSSRPFQELRKVWGQLCAKPAVHVDSTLAGSGSSRNQPETIFANLPYVEYLYIENRKHLSLMTGNTHDAGSIRQMDGIQAQKVREEFAAYGRGRVKPPGVLMLLDNLSEGAKAIERVYGTSVQPILGLPGIYKLYDDVNRIIVAEARKYEILGEPGYYLIARSRLQTGKKIGLEIDGYEIEILEETPLTILSAIAKPR